MKKLILILGLFLPFILNAKTYIVDFDDIIESDTIIGEYVGNASRVYSIQATTGALTGTGGTITIVKKNTGHEWAEVADLRLPHPLVSNATYVIGEGKLETEYIGFKIDAGSFTDGNIKISITYKQSL